MEETEIDLDAPGVVIEEEIVQEEQPFDPLISYAEIISDLPGWIEPTTDFMPTSESEDDTGLVPEHQAVNEDVMVYTDLLIPMEFFRVTAPNFRGGTACGDKPAIVDDAAEGSIVGVPKLPLLPEIVDDVATGSIIGVPKLPLLPGMTLRGSWRDDVLKGGKGDDLIRGRGGDDVISGGKGRDDLDGGKGNDLIKGGKGADVLDGGAGTDILTGGRGADVFEFDHLSDLGKGRGRDKITDFGARDLIDLSDLDANTQKKGMQEFDFVDDSAFSGKAGELRFDGRILAADLDGDKHTDFQIEFTKFALLTEDSFIF